MFEEAPGSVANDLLGAVRSILHQAGPQAPFRPRDR